jgi:hypothetical protein
MTFMKKTIAYIILMSLSVTSFSQQMKPSDRRRISDDYMIKSQHLKTTAWVMLGGGLALTAGGIILIATDSHTTDNNGYYDDNSLTTQQVVGAVLVYAGVLSSLGSIPLFIVSRAMYKRAIRVSSFLQMEKVPPVQISGIPIQPFPALGVKISL